MNYLLEVKPAIPVGVRHKLQDFLKSEGYEVSGGGQMTDGSSCDVSFSDEKALRQSISDLLATCEEE